MRRRARFRLCSRWMASGSSPSKARCCRGSPPTAAASTPSPPSFQKARRTRSARRPAWRSPSRSDLRAGCATSPVPSAGALTLRESAPVGGHHRHVACVYLVPSAPPEPSARLAAQGGHEVERTGRRARGAAALKVARQAALRSPPRSRPMAPTTAEVGESPRSTMGMIERRARQPQGGRRALSSGRSGCSSRAGHRKRSASCSTTSAAFSSQQTGHRRRVRRRRRAPSTMPARPVLGRRRTMHVGYALNNLALLWDAKGDQGEGGRDLRPRHRHPRSGRWARTIPRLAPFLEDQRTLRRKAGRE